MAELSLTINYNPSPETLFVLFVTEKYLSKGDFRVTLDGGTVNNRTLAEMAEAEGLYEKAPHLKVLVEWMAEGNRRRYSTLETGRGQGATPHTDRTWKRAVEGLNLISEGRAEGLRRVIEVANLAYAAIDEHLAATPDVTVTAAGQLLLVANLVPVVKAYCAKHVQAWRGNDFEQAVNEALQRVEGEWTKAASDWQNRWRLVETNHVYEDGGSTLCQAVRVALISSDSTRAAEYLRWLLNKRAQSPVFVVQFEPGSKFGSTRYALFAPPGLTLNVVVAALRQREARMHGVSLTDEEAQKAGPCSITTTRGLVELIYLGQQDGRLAGNYLPANRLSRPSQLEPDEVVRLVFDAIEGRKAAHVERRQPTLKASLGEKGRRSAANSGQPGRNRGRDNRRHW
ncbi:MAG: hypothetical protein PHT12_04760 [Patescibacteria group bacterium]|nr:hypothetical protein [Patescibacteria group bacterium]